MQLGHKAKDKVESRYNRAEFEEERREMMQFYADSLVSGITLAKGYPIRCY
jgi:hypothetical protein